MMGTMGEAGVVCGGVRGERRGPRYLEDVAAVEAQRQVSAVQAAADVLRAGARRDPHLDDHLVQGLVPAAPRRPAPHHPAALLEAARHGARTPGPPGPPDRPPAQAHANPPPPSPSRAGARAGARPPPPSGHDGRRTRPLTLSWRRRRPPALLAEAGFTPGRKRGAPGPQRQDPRARPPRERGGKPAPPFTTRSPGAEGRKEPENGASGGRGPGPPDVTSGARLRAAPGGVCACPEAARAGIGCGRRGGPGPLRLNLTGEGREGGRERSGSHNPPGSVPSDMSFSKAPLKRFNDAAGCAPPPGSYDVKSSEVLKGPVSFEKSQRFRKQKATFVGSQQSLNSDKDAASPPTARKHKILESQIRDLVKERGMQDKRHRDLEAELEKTEVKLNAAVREKTSLSANIASLEKQLMELTRANEFLKLKFSDDGTQKKMSSLSMEVMKLRSKMEAKTKSAAAKQEDMEMKLQLAQRNLQQTQGIVAQIEEKLLSTEKEIVEEKSDTGRLLDYIEQLSCLGEREKYKEDIFYLEEIFKEKNNELSILKNSLEEKDCALSRKIKELTSACQLLEEENGRLIAEHKEQEHNLNVSLQSLKEKLQLEQEHQKLQQEHSLSAEIHSLKEKLLKEQEENKKVQQEQAHRFSAEIQGLKEKLQLEQQEHKKLQQEQEHSFYAEIQSLKEKLKLEQEHEKHQQEQERSLGAEIQNLKDKLKLQEQHEKLQQEQKHGLCVEIQSLKEKLNLEQEEHEKQQQEQESSLGAEIQSLKDKLKLREQEHEKLQQEREHSFSAEIQSLKEKLKLEQEEHEKHQQEQESSLGAEIQKLKDKLKLREQEHEKLQQEQEHRFSAEIQSLKGKLKQEQEEHEKQQQEQESSLGAEIHSLKNTLKLHEKAQQEQEHSLRAEIQSLKEKLKLEQEEHEKQQQEQESSLATEIQSLKDQLKLQEQEHEKLQQEQTETALLLQREKDLCCGLQKNLLDLQEEMTNERNLLEEELKQTLDELDKLQEKEERAENLVKDLEEEMKLRIKELKHLEEELKRKMGNEDTIAGLTEEIKTWRFLYEELHNKTKPFEQQLDAYEKEKNALLNEHGAAQEELTKLSESYAKLLGHQNQKQKIKHVMKLKEENGQLKSEVSKLRSQLVKEKETGKKLQEQLNEAKGIRRFDPAKAFQHESKENVVPKMPLKESKINYC
uniref:Hyaluronan-mediated motility receptor C-terminal domain-containing protein n=1 Tax=Ornithorhynchus anatinus TaxID=9258 RepID=F6X1M8_ORNAN